MTDTHTPPETAQPAPFELQGLATFALLAVVFALWGALGSALVSPMALFLPVVVPVGIWVAWNDMAYMKIPNVAVLTLTLAFAVIGLFAFPLEDYLWRWSHLVVLLLIGIVANAARLMGAGDAKFIAAMAPIIAYDDLGGVLRLFAATLLAAYVTHRFARRIPALGRVVGHWESWTRRDFPMGLALGCGLILYVGLKAYFGR